VAQTLDVAGKHKLVALLAPGSRISPERFWARMARRKIKKALVVQWTGGDWTEGRTTQVEHVTKWRVPLSNKFNQGARQARADRSFSMYAIPAYRRDSLLHSALLGPILFGLAR
jgi:hypothetical protein